MGAYPVWDSVLMVLTQPRPGDDAEFHAWYDQEHLPARISLPGIHSAGRFRATDGRNPEWLALYDLDASVLTSQAYRQLREDRSQRERAVIDRLSVLDRRVYRVLADFGAHTESCLRIVNWFTLEPSARPELLRWYELEHAPGLLEIPGWTRVTVAELVEGNGPSVVALHEVSDDSVFETDVYHALKGSAWRDRLYKTIVSRERRSFRRLQDGSP